MKYSSFPRRSKDISDLAFSNKGYMNKMGEKPELKSMEEFHNSFYPTMQILCQRDQEIQGHLNNTALN